MKNLLIFLTHNFTPIFKKTLSQMNNKYDDLDVTILFDNAHSYDSEIENELNNIKIIKIDKINTSYDNYGHSMYIHYFRQNPTLIDNYNFIWIIENDVYYPISIKNFIDKYNSYSYDLLVPEYGLRDVNWHWTYSLRGFRSIQNIGVLAVIMRFSNKLLKNLIDNIDIHYFGFIEAILPHICIDNNYSIQQFLPEMCGILTTKNNDTMLELIKKDITNNTWNFIEYKIYHPVK